MSTGSATRRLRDWAELCRLPNLFTAMADPLAGALIVGATWRDAHWIGLLMIASACLYAGGIALNDWHDFKKDLDQRPQRPLPSKRIGRIEALAAIVVLLGLGMGIASLVGPTATYVAGLLLASIVAYDVILKEIPIAPAIMGFCRSLNLVLGMTLVPSSAADTIAWPLRVYLAAALGLYVLGVTVFARKEADPTEKSHLIAAASVSIVAILIVAGERVFFLGQAHGTGGMIWLLCLAAAIGFRMSQAILTPTPLNVQGAVKAALLGIILFDAALVAYIRDPLASLPVVVLLVPALWFARKTYTT